MDQQAAGSRQQAAGSRIKSAAAAGSRQGPQDESAAAGGIHGLRLVSSSKQ